MANMVTVLIITRNEAANIARCLRSVAWADERIVVDSGSTDETVAIARAMGATVIEHDWEGFAAQKNFAHTVAGGDWILSLDADERQGQLRGSYQTCKTKPTRALAPGDRIGSLEAIAAPGHTPGQLAFFDLRDRALIAGDAFQTRGGVAVSGTWRPLFPFPAMATWHAPTALASARALRARKPSLLAIGHGVVLTEPLPAIDQAIADAAQHLREDLAHAA